MVSGAASLVDIAPQSLLLHESLPNGRVEIVHTACLGVTHSAGNVVHDVLFDGVEQLQPPPIPSVHNLDSVGVEVTLNQ